MASSPITSRQIDGETRETVRDFNLLGSKITADGDCSHEIKRRLLLGRKDMTSLDSVLKSRDITLPAKVCLVKAMVLPVVMYGCEIWIWRKLSTEEQTFKDVTAKKQSILISSVAQLCLTLCDLMDCSMPGFPVHHQLLTLAQTHVWVSDAIQPSHLLSTPSPPALNLSQH